MTPASRHDEPERFLVQLDNGALNLGPLQTIESASKNKVLKRATERINLLGQAVPDAAGNMVIAGKENTSAGNIDPAIGVFMLGPLIYHGWFAHLDTMSFRHIVDGMRMHCVKAIIEHERSLTTGVSGVRLNCMGDTDICERPPCEAFRISDELISSPKPLQLPVADKLGLPLNASPIAGGSALAWEGRHMHGETSTFAINTQAIILDPDLWNSETGSVLICRKDRKALHLAHMYALILYCKQIGRTLQVKPSTNGDMDRDILPEVDVQFLECSKRLLQNASKEGFQELYIKFMDMGGREKYGDVPSPYDVSVL